MVHRPLVRPASFRQPPWMPLSPFAKPFLAVLAFAIACQGIGPDARLGACQATRGWYASVRPQTWRAIALSPQPTGPDSADMPVPFRFLNWLGRRPDFASRPYRTQSGKNLIQRQRRCWTGIHYRFVGDIDNALLTGKRETQARRTAAASDQKISITSQGPSCCSVSGKNYLAGTGNCCPPCKQNLSKILSAGPKKSC